MSKKILIPLIIAILLALVGGGVVLASGNQSTDNTPVTLTQSVINGDDVHRGFGQVTSIGTDAFTIKNLRLVERSFQVNSKTHFRTIDGASASFGNLQMGQWVLVRINDNDAKIASVVTLFPMGFTPAEINSHFNGDVTSLNVSGNTFMLHSRDGHDLTFMVNANTIFTGQVTSLSGLQSGMLAEVWANKTNGTLTAIIVRAHAKNEQFLGTVTAFNLSSSTFSLHTRQGEDMTFTVNANTRFNSDDGKVNNLGGLIVGMIAHVAARDQGNGTLLALRVMVVDISGIDVRVRGEVLSIGNDFFTIRNRVDKVFTFQVTPSTQIRSRGGFVQSLQDLKTGMVTLVGAKNLGQGKFQAMKVWVVRRLIGK